MGQMGSAVDATICTDSTFYLEITPLYMKKKVNCRNLIVFFVFFLAYVSLPEIVLDFFSKKTLSQLQEIKRNLSKWNPENNKKKAF